jgi:hypothetical protein
MSFVEKYFRKKVRENAQKTDAEILPATAKGEQMEETSKTTVPSNTRSECLLRVLNGTGKYKDICRMFDWSDTPQGQAYWNAFASRYVQRPGWQEAAAPHREEREYLEQVLKACTAMSPAPAPTSEASEGPVVQREGLANFASATLLKRLLLDQYPSPTVPDRLPSDFSYENVSILIQNDDEHEWCSGMQQAEMLANSFSWSDTPDLLSFKEWSEIQLRMMCSETAVCLRKEYPKEHAWLKGCVVLSQQQTNQQKEKPKTEWTLEESLQTQSEDYLQEIMEAAEFEFKQIVTILISDCPLMNKSEVAVSLRKKLKLYEDELAGALRSNASLPGGVCFQTGPAHSSLFLGSNPNGRWYLRHRSRWALSTASFLTDIEESVAMHLILASDVLPTTCQEKALRLLCVRKALLSSS